MDNISNSSFYENLIIIYTKKLFFLIFFIFSYLFIYFLLNFLIQVSSPQKNQFLLSLNNNQRDILTNYFFIKNINDNFDESIKNEILKSNLPQINAEKIIAKLSLSFNSSYLHFLENSIKYSFYLENNINYLNDYKAINKNLTIIEEFFSIKDSVFIFNYVMC